MTQHFLALLMLASITATAQPTLTGAGVNPVPGQSTTFYSTSLSSPGSSGANVTWNFSSLPNNGTAPMSYIACSAAPDCGTMTGTDVVADNGANYIYYISNSVKHAWRGLSAGGVVMDYSNPDDYLHFPFTYTNTYADSFKATFYSGTDFTRLGETVVEADGYGTLILPNGTYNNVLRVHRTSNYVDQVMGMTMFEYSSESYQWYQQGYKEVLLSSASLTTAAGTTLAEFYTSPPVTAVSSIAAGITTLNTYPNPAKDVVNILFSSSERVSISMSLCDVTGRTMLKIQEKEYPSGSNTETLNVSNLPKGVYILQLKAGTETASRRIEVL